MQDIPLRQHNAGRKGGPPDAIVLHWSAGSGDELALGQYFQRNPGRDASYHYGIGRSGGVGRYVDEANTAWHAGDGEPWEGKEKGRRINARSVGICLCSLGPVDAKWAKAHPERTLTADHMKRSIHSRTWERPTPEQVAALRELIAGIKSRWPSIRFVVGHDDVTRAKQDPGPTLDGVDLGLEALGLTRIRRRWDRAGAPWEGLEATRALPPRPAEPTPQASAPEPEAPELEPSPAAVADAVAQAAEHGRGLLALLGLRQAEPMTTALAIPAPAMIPQAPTAPAPAPAAAQVADPPAVSAPSDHGIAEDQEAAPGAVE